MNPSFYKKKWDLLQKDPDNVEAPEQLAGQVAHSFMDRYFHDGHYEGEYIQILCEMAVFPQNPEITTAASLALFEIIVEGLCDDFEELQTETYNKVMSDVISYCRKAPAGKDLDERLNDFGLYSYQDLLGRIENIRKNNNAAIQSINIQKILILSRVTIGADVAITSVIAQRLNSILPEAEIVILGNRKLKELFAGNPHLRIKEINYSRRGGLLDRLKSWHVLLRAIEQEHQVGSMDNTILVDTDSRYSQLGVLPLIQPQNYLFFPSRHGSPHTAGMSMAERTNHWLNKLYGKTDFFHPKVWPLTSYMDRAVEFCNNLRRNGCQRIVSINFGVGGNQRKRISIDFEMRLLMELLQEPGTVILLDKGFGDKELTQTDFLLDGIKSHGYFATTTRFESLKTEKISGGIIGIQSRIGEMAALIAQCDEFIGYDSAFQHISASLGVPTLTVFAGSNNMRFIRTWRSCGPNGCEIVHVDTLTNPHKTDIDNVIIRIMDKRKRRAL